MALGLTEAWRIGQTPDRPANILAMLSYRSFGDFVGALFFVNSIADRFDHKTVTLMYRDDQDFKNDMVTLVPDSMVVKVPAGVPYPTFDLIDQTLEPMITDPRLQPWFAAGRNLQNIVITDAMAQHAMFWTLERHCPLRIQDQDVASCTQTLIEKGLDPNRWFCTVHAREPGYGDKGIRPNFRDCDPNIFQQAIFHIVHALGGQVVRLGHPAMTPFPPTQGVVDLSRDEGNSILQAFAISRSRYFIGGPSGPSSVADVFRVPTGIADYMDYCPHNPGTTIRTPDLVAPDGQVVRQSALFELGHSKLSMMKLLGKNVGYQVVRNSAAEVIRLVNFVHERTGDTLGWRPPAPVDLRPRPNQFSWPPGKPIARGCFLPVD